MLVYKNEKKECNFIKLSRLVDLLKEKGDTSNIKHYRQRGLFYTVKPEEDLGEGT